MNGFFLSTASLNRLPEEARAAVLAELGLSGVTTDVGDVSESLVSGTDESLARLNDRQARRLVQKPLSDISRRMLEAAAQLDPHFRIRDLLEKMGLERYGQLRGPLSGLTRRTRSILNDREVSLFLQVEERETDEDSIAQMHPETRAALRRVLNTGG
ncbi:MULTISPECIES: hypothetical protein [unclassified Bradyrhizobium]|uniref:hypothetical protein n=1 Tax=unclassified Bradyrhizobium TaxID=2631580 RepID=UPI001FFBC076|nr:MULTISPECIES: hypothetical protein [unclassified Bradyrhizobium]MCK1305712.1 hypothetical protein [Bradyrhizobium sp. 45]MCK1440323.1 hypothetical protein [Bradyrhizobium sp. 15]MCK1612297.1 hypothetical protein [Bradyrhizobium sp. 163]MCK1765661.1 hypothetical protein [Bradyrhizobium sp. 136]